MGLYLEMLTTRRYLETLLYTVGLSVAVTVATLDRLQGSPACSSSATNFTGKHLLVAMLTFPLAFPGVVVGFMIILLAGPAGFDWHS